MGTMMKSGHATLGCLSYDKTGGEGREELGGRENEGQGIGVKIFGV